MCLVGINSNYHVAAALSRSRTAAAATRLRGRLRPPAARMSFARNVQCRLKVLEADMDSRMSRLQQLSASERRQLEVSLRQRGLCGRRLPAASRLDTGSRTNSLHSGHSQQHDDLLITGGYRADDDEHLLRLLELMQLVQTPSIEHWNVKPDENLDNDGVHNVIFHM